VLSIYNVDFDTYQIILLGYVKNYVFVILAISIFVVGRSL
jgi:hypothetical protein